MNLKTHAMSKLKQDKLSDLLFTYQCRLEFLLVVPKSDAERSGHEKDNGGEDDTRNQSCSPDALYHFTLGLEALHKTVAIRGITFVGLGLCVLTSVGWWFGCFVVH